MSIEPTHERTDIMGETRITRRGFLGAALAGGALLSGAGCARRGAGISAGPTIVPRHVLGGAGYVPPSERVRLAAIGCGGKGYSDIRHAARDNTVVALCDIDHTEWSGRRARLSPAATFAEFPDAARYSDWRRMLDEMADRIDAVTVSTADHMHAPAAVRAMEMGKHVYVQKPMAQTVHETQLLAETARRTGVATQMGHQGHASEGTRLLCEWIWGGTIGAVREVHLWTDRPIWPQGLDRPTGSAPVPAGVAWDLWLGSAPERPWLDGVYHPFNWRGWWDFGCGALGDMGCHVMDAAYWALDLRGSVRVQAEVSDRHTETAPKWSRITYDFPARGPRPPVKVVWYDGAANGGPLPERPSQLEPDRKFAERDMGGQLYYGDDGAILASYNCASVRLIPEERMREINPARNVAKTLARVPDHYADWIMACKGQGRSSADFAYSAPLTEMVLLGNVAIRAGREIHWDAEQRRIVNAPEADRYLTKSYRKGWEIG